MLQLFSGMRLPSYIRFGIRMQEALEVGATTLLLDEDTCASNFMHRDARMRVRSHLSKADKALLLQVHCSTTTDQSCREPCEIPAAHVLMQALVPKDPITPFNERIGSLSAAGVSCVRLVSSANAMPTVPPAVTRSLSV
jgi:Predicted ATPase of the ABC class